MGEPWLLHEPALFAAAEETRLEAHVVRWAVNAYLNAVGAVYVAVKSNSSPPDPSKEPAG